MTQNLDHTKYSCFEIKYKTFDIWVESMADNSGMNFSIFLTRLVAGPLRERT